ncbi:MAG: ribosome silencing factor [Bacteroidetes bacterium 4572_117]|nr:MAG: ribosome silencing factor [Bacteroidetes bacterium 4572_117]
MVKIENPGEKLVNAIVAGMKEKKAVQISILNLEKLEQAVCDYFVICNAESTTQVSAIADSVGHFTLTEAKEKPFHIEGSDNATWILLDYGNVIVHVFQNEFREFYNIEEFWADAVRTDIDEIS